MGQNEAILYTEKLTTKSFYDRSIQENLSSRSQHVVFARSLQKKERKTNAMTNLIVFELNQKPLVNTLYDFVTSHPFFLGRALQMLNLQLKGLL